MKEYICANCLNVGQPKRMKRGNRWLERLLWLVFPLGLPYNIWCMCSKYNACKQCGGNDIVLTSTLYGQKLLMRFDREILGYVPTDLNHVAKIKIEQNDFLPNFETDENFNKTADLIVKTAATNSDNQKTKPLASNQDDW